MWGSIGPQRSVAVEKFCANPARVMRIEKALCLVPLGKLNSTKGWFVMFSEYEISDAADTQLPAHEYAMMF